MQPGEGSRPVPDAFVGESYVADEGSADEISGESGGGMNSGIC